jgi:Asp-tRNA(Asn)/Glu-tRNA(Gln) amidotransferase A subunit family amidase
MWTGLLRLFGGYVPLIQFGVIAALLASGAYLAHDYKSLGVQNANLRTELSETKNKLSVVEASRILDRDAIRALDERLKQKTDDLSVFCEILGGIKENGEVAGEPIGAALEALKKLGEKK